MKIVISGAGVAGPMLAYWLLRSGHDVTLVEAASALRTGGYIVDFWGLGYELAERVGILPRVLELGYQVREVRLVDRHGKRRGGFDVSVFTRATEGRFTSIRRSDLATTLYGAIDGRVETMFGDSIAGIEEHVDGVDLTFDHASPRRVDLVVGADGLHSAVRRLMFGPDDRFEVPLGYHVGAFEVTGYRPREELVYFSHGMPGRQISRFSMRNDRTLFLCIFRDEFLPRHAGLHSDQKQLIREVFREVGWEAPAMLEALDQVDNVYLDRVSQIRMPHWSRGRTALVGDAAAAVSLMAGEGTGLALIESYVLAGELQRAGGDHRVAFPRYQERLMPFLQVKQAAAARFASSFVPRTALGMRVRDLGTALMRVPLVAEYFIGKQLRDEISLPAYWTAPD